MSEFSMQHADAPPSLQCPLPLGDAMYRRRQYCCLVVRLHSTGRIFQRVLFENMLRMCNALTFLCAHLDAVIACSASHAERHAAR